MDSTSSHTDSIKLTLNKSPILLSLLNLSYLLISKSSRDARSSESIYIGTEHVLISYLLYYEHYELCKEVHEYLSATTEFEITVPVLQEFITLHEQKKFPIPGDPVALNKPLLYIDHIQFCPQLQDLLPLFSTIECNALNSAIMKDCFLHILEANGHSATVFSVIDMNSLTSSIKAPLINSEEKILTTKVKEFLLQESQQDITSNTEDLVIELFSTYGPSNLADAVNELES